MKQLLEMYYKYYCLQEELFKIQHDKMHWPKDWNYNDMVNRVNELTPEIRMLADKINTLEQACMVA